MITIKGEQVISKYLIGQTTSYASYIAIGCGAAPVLPGTALNTTEIAIKESLDFETLRVPITSRGYITEIIEGNTYKQLVVTAQVPAEGRYGITEVGIYPAVSNPVAESNDSRSLLTFDNNEQWLAVVGGVSNVIAESSIATSGSTITQASPIFANTFDVVMGSQLREQNNEIPRNGVYSILTPGELTTFTGDVPSGDYLLLSNPAINLSNSSATDKLKIAFSIMSNDPLASISGTARIMLEFGAAQEIGGTAQYARATFDIALDNTNRYYISEINVKDIVFSNGFSWTNATYLKVFVDSGSAGNVVVLDGLRVDNVNSVSPVYGLVGYTVIKNSLTTSSGTTKAVPVVKEKDKTNLIEFRFRVSVV